MKDKKERVIQIFIGILLVAAVVVVVMAVKIKDEKAVQLSENAAKQSEAAETAEKWQEGDVDYNGKTYRYNPSVKTYLFLGTDNEGTTEEFVGGFTGGQSDAMFLLVTNGSQKTMSVIAIHRNTMALVDIYDLVDNCVEQKEMQICLQYAYGDGGRESCLRTVDAVSRLFYGIPIHYYFSMNMDAIPLLNDAVGGVRVEVMDDLENKSLGVSLKKGETVTLNGDEAYVYIRSRDINEFDSAGRRLERQQQYLLQLFKRLDSLALGNEATIEKVSGVMEDYFVTNIDFAKLAEDTSEYVFDEGQMYSVLGEAVMGEIYEEFYVNEEALYEMILEIFYEEVGN